MLFVVGVVVRLVVIYININDYLYNYNGVVVHAKNVVVIYIYLNDYKH